MSVLLGVMQMHRAEVEGRAENAARHNLSGNTDQDCPPFLGNKVTHKVTLCPSVPGRKQARVLLLSCLYLVCTVFVGM